MLSWLLKKLVGIPDAPEPTRANRPGSRTSEGKLALLNTLVAAVLAVLAIWLPDMPREALREVLLWIGGIIAAAASGTYSLSRALVKRELAKLEAAELRGPAANDGGAPEP